jgi:LPS sulfotransferase NodH
VCLPSCSYLICANQRSGSTLLCRALSDTGVAGHPEEYFLDGPPEAFPAGWRFWEDGILAYRHGGVGDRREYLQLVYRVGTSDNGVFGAKLMWNNVVWAVRRFRELDELAHLTQAELFHTAFPNLKVVHLVRRDLVRQAVSWARAAQDGIWVLPDNEGAEAATPVYRRQLIADLHGLLVEGERGWRGFYEELALNPHEVAYEDLVTEEGYGPAIRGVLEHLEVDAQVAIPPPRTARRADDLNEEWIRRFRAEADAEVA